MKKQSWVIHIEHTVRKTIVTSDCTEEEAMNDPFANAIEERETDSLDWEVLSIEPNE